METITAYAVLFIKFVRHGIQIGMLRHGLMESRIEHTNLRVIDGNNDPLSTAELATLEFTGKEEGMDVDVTMLRTKTVPLRMGYTGTPDPDYSFSSISYKPESIEIAGTSEIITGVTEIVVPDEAVNIDGIIQLQTTAPYFYMLHIIMILNIAYPK